MEANKSVFRNVDLFLFTLIFSPYHVLYTHHVTILYEPIKSGLESEINTSL